MVYHDISLVSIIGLCGTLYVQTANSAEAVSVQTEGPYEAKEVADSWLVIYPEGQEPQLPLRYRTGITAQRTHIGSVDVAAKVRSLNDARPRMRPPAPGPARAQAAVRITAPRGTKFELIRCHGMRKGPRGWHFMRGGDRFHIR
jgi:hypothetical protein